MVQVHLPNPYIKTTCKKLGVEWADALVGFERRKGMNFPSIQVRLASAPCNMVMSLGWLRKGVLQWLAALAVGRRAANGTSEASAGTMFAFVARCCRVQLTHVECTTSHVPPHIFPLPC